MLTTTHILLTTGVNNPTYQHAMLIKIVMLTRNFIYLWYVEFYVKMFRIKLHLVEGAGVTPLKLVLNGLLHLVEKILVNIMFWTNDLRLWASALLYIFYMLFVICNVLFVTCSVLLGAYSYIYNALGVYCNAITRNTGFKTIDNIQSNN